MLTITKKDKSTFPAFFNHKSARLWFKSVYGNRFVMQGTGWMDGEKVYYYNLVKDRESYLYYQERMMQGEIMDDVRDFEATYQKIIVWDNGRIKVDY